MERRGALRCIGGAIVAAFGAGCDIVVRPEPDGSVRVPEDVAGASVWDVTRAAFPDARGEMRYIHKGGPLGFWVSRLNAVSPDEGEWLIFIVNGQMPAHDARTHEVHAGDEVRWVVISM